ncbi:MAG TPA: sodium-dependent transporter, partial [Candidatus Blautia pullicola]|nr:sodium-dependent transporter [Candidatus Blautia pullicola]
MEFSVGRASQKSIARSFNELEKKGTKWHLYRYVGMAGNYLLMMFYTTIGGWMLIYFFKMVKGDFVGLDADGVAQAFSNLTGDLKTMVIWMLVIVILGFLVCSMGLQSGVERINKTMMVVLFLLMVVLAINSSLLPGASEGLKFYLLPDFGKLTEYPISEVIFAAMGQAFFTLSCGIGALAIFGSYIGKERKLTGEAINILVLDTAVALIAGLIIFPACFAYGIDPGEGPGLIFVTLPNVFNHMAMGRLWGSLFFLFMTFAALTTIIAVFQNIISCVRDLWGWSLKKASLINGVLIAVLSLPCIFGMTIWSDFSFIGKSVLDLEDFIVSNNILPLGSLVYLLFCVNRYGWGWDNFIKEANTGRGISFPSKLRVYFTYILPIIILYIFLQGYWSLFQTL